MPRAQDPSSAGDASRPGPPLKVRTAYLLSQVGRAQSGRFQEALQPTGLRPKQFAMLNHVALAEGISQRELGRRLALDPSGLVGTIDALERRGYLERRADPDDRRRRALHLTSAGESKLWEGRRAAGRTAAELLEGFDDEEITALHDLLARISVVQEPRLAPAAA